MRSGGCSGIALVFHRVVAAAVQDVVAGVAAGSRRKPRGGVRPAAAVAALVYSGLLVGKGPL